MKKILVVDDSAAIRQSTTFVLEQAGFGVVQASDGREGLEKAEKESFDLVLTDINMPVMDGIELLKRLRAIERYAKTPVVVLTTESQQSKMNEGKAAGATGWIVKPFEAEKLIGVVKMLLE